MRCPRPGCSDLESCLHGSTQEMGIDFLGSAPGWNETEIEKILSNHEVIPPRKLKNVGISMLKGSAPITPHGRDRVDKPDSRRGFLGHGAQPQPRHTPGASQCVPRGLASATPAGPLLAIRHPSRPRSWALSPLPAAFRDSVRSDGKCLVVTMTLGQCSFPMHTNILWLLYMNIFNDMEKVVDFLKFFFFVCLEL